MVSLDFFPLFFHDQKKSKDSILKRYLIVFFSFFFLTDQAILLVHDSPYDSDDTWEWEPGKNGVKWVIYATGVDNNAPTASIDRVLV